jgi:glycosyltransferase involved in cell wall biosynthesis
MLHNVFLTFKGNGIVTTHKQLFASVQNTFTIEFWVKPEAAHRINTESTRGVSGTKGQRFVITPMHGAYGDGDPSRAGVGVSVGINGISVYEHTTDHLPATLVLETSLRDWTHIAVVYDNKTPTLYINGEFAKKGLTSTKRIVVPSGVFGGVSPYGFYVGGLEEIRIWSTARTQAEIQQNMSRELTGKEAGLFGYWRLDEGAGATAHDLTVNGNDGVITEANWNTPQGEVLSDKSMTVLFTFFIPSGGIETLNRQRLYALNQAGIKCHFLYTQEGTGLQNKVNAPIFITNNHQEIIEIIKKEKYDAIVVSSDLLLLKKIKESGYTGSLIYEVQGLGFNKEYAEQFVTDHAYPVLQSDCDAILYPKTPHLISVFEKYFPAKKKFCFHNCFNTTEFQYRVHPKEKKPIIGWVGRIEENKNWKDFLLIGAELIKRSPSIQLWMFEDNTLGEKSERIAFEHRINELNLSKNLTIYANQPHHKMAEYFSIIGDSGGFLCSTSKVEGFGYAVLEAMICRCPVLSTDSDGVRSFIIHNETGKFFELGNINQAVEEARNLMANIWLREKIRKQGVAHIKEHFSPEKYAENFLNMIYSLKGEN